MRHDTPGWTAKSPTLAKTGLSALVYLAFSLAVMWRTLQHPYTSFIGGPGDPQQFIWYLGWFWHALGTGQNPLVTHSINYPVGQNLMWNTSVLAQACVVGWLSFIINGTFLYNLLWVVNFVVTSVVGERILTTLRVRRPLALFGGALFGILPYTTSQSLFHMHLWFTCVAMGLIHLMVRATGQRPRHPALYGGVLGVLTAIQFYSSIEVFTTMVFVAVFVVVIAFSVLGRSAKAYAPKLSPLGWGIACLTALVVSAPGLYVLFLGANRPHATLLPADLYVNDLASFVVPTPVFLLHSTNSDTISSWFTGNFWENNAYLGLPVLVLLLWAAFVLRRQRAAVAAFVSLIFISLCSLGPHLHVRGRITHVPMPWSAILHVPFIDNAIPSRLMFYADILVVILILYAVEITMHSRRVSRVGQLALALWLCAALCSWLPQVPYYTTMTPPDAAALTPNSPVYAAVNDQPTYVLTKDASVAMQAIAEHGYPFPMVNPYGYTSNSPIREQQLNRLNAIASMRLSGPPARTVIRTALPALHASRVLYFPAGASADASRQIVSLVSTVLGPPMAESAAGVVVWRVPAE